jgi:DnaK suppressor protein
MQLKKIEIEELKEQLIEKKKELMKGLAETMKVVSSPDQASGSGYGTHVADSDTTDLYRGLGLSEAERALIREIDEALERIEKGTYGICIESGDPIPYKRLKIIPWASRTLEEQTKFEHMNKSQKW